MRIDVTAARGKEINYDKTINISIKRKENRTLIEAHSAYFIQYVLTYN